MVSDKIKNITKIILFCLILLILFIFLNIFFQPTFGRENNHLAKKEFNNEPKDSIDTVFIGSSVVHHDISVMEMYRDHGICAWNLGSSMQPLSASYYTLEDAYRQQSGSLKNVFLEVFQLKYEPNEALRRSMTDAIKYFDIKLRSNIDFYGDTKEALDYSIPVISYHNRWQEIGKDDFVKLNGNERSYLRGYYLDTVARYYDLREYDEMTVPNCNFSNDQTRTAFPAENMYYLKKIIEFCNEKGLNLILFKSPMAETWEASDHNAVCDIADTYGIIFLDLNYEPYFDELGYNYAVDQADGDHMNYYGVRKFSGWLGKYLAENGMAKDVRGDNDYQHIEKQYSKYKNKVIDLVELKGLNDPVDYLKRASEKDFYTIFIAVQEDAANSLTEEQRTLLKESGLIILSAVGMQDSYIGVIDRSQGTIFEDIDTIENVTEVADMPESNIELMEKTTLEEVEELRKGYHDESEDAPEEINGTEHKGNLSDGGYYLIKSGKKDDENIASIIINDEEYSLNQRGLNIVIYDNDIHEVVESTTFDTSGSSTRLGEDLETELEKALIANPDPEALPERLKKLYMYNERCREAIETQGASLAAETDGE